MAVMDLPCDGDGVCMVCKAKPTEADSLLCTLCVTPWHVPCLCHPPENMASAASWQCPDCAPPPEDAVADAAPAVAAATGAATGLITSIRAIEADTTLTEQQKAKKRQELLGGAAAMADDEEDEEKDDGKEASESKNSMLNLLDQAFNCSFCMKLPERPVTTPCGHNFCLKCFQKWTSQRKDATCIKCRSRIPPAMASQPRINSTLVMAIRMAKTAKINAPGKTQVYHYIRNDERPEKAFTTDRAKKTGKANACSGAIFVSSPPDHFGPITAEYDPKRNQGVLVGETWEDRFECRQWGAHLPHVAGIAGQSTYGAQSVALSGGYIDDEDHGEWFLYTGSGGRDLSGNKRTNKEQAFDQKFDKMNQALRVSCQKGYPVRVVRSHKEKRSAYAPEKGVRYDGVYRIEKCWRKVGCQGFKVCRYLFVRCDNEPAPWTSDEHGDRPRPLPDIKELKGATDITERKDSPAWDYDEKSGWKWKKSPPASKKPVYVQDPDDAKKQYKRIHQAQHLSVKDKLLKEFSCLICHKVMTLPVTTPCAHNFCKSCLIGAYEGLQFVKERTREGGRSLRAQKVVNKCPCCPTDISEYLKDPQVNREVMDLIQSLQTNSEDESSGVSNDENQGSLNKSNGKVTDHLSATANGISKDSGDTSDTSDVITDADGQANDNHADQRSSASESLPPSSKRQKRDTSTKN